MTEYRSLNDFFEELNKDVKYVILRNFENLFEDLTILAHPDMDFLCENRQKFLEIVSTESRGKSDDFVHRKVRIAGKEVAIDIREVGDGYLDSAWEKKILSNRVMTDRGFYVPDKENYLFSLLYHVLIQKKQIASDYQEKLKGVIGQADVFERNSLLRQLEEYMRTEGYQYTYPESSSTVFFISSVSRDLIEKSLKKRIARFVHKII